MEKKKVYEGHVLYEGTRVCKGRRESFLFVVPFLSVDITVIITSLFFFFFFFFIPHSSSYFFFFFFVSFSLCHTVLYIGQEVST